MLRINTASTLACYAIIPCVVATPVFADLSPGNLLTINPAETSITYYGGTRVDSGSYFAMDFNGDGRFSSNERTAMEPGESGGLVLGELQPATSFGTCSSSGSSGLIDAPWCFFGITGAHQTTTKPITVIDNGTLDFSGWGATWNAIPNIDLGGHIAGGDTGRAIITCSSPGCNRGDSYVLDYTAVIKPDDPSGFGGMSYSLHLEGYIDAAAPVTDIKVTVSGGDVQECTSSGGSSVSASAFTTVQDSDSIASVDWAINGLHAGTGDSITGFLSLGRNIISATLTTTNGHTDISSAIVEIKDTVAPIVSADFIDVLRRSSLKDLRRFNTVKIKAFAEDVCDPEPEVEAMIGAPVSDGDRMYIMKYFGNVSMNLSEIDLFVMATDASRNTTKQTATINIK